MSRNAFPKGNQYWKLRDHEKNARNKAIAMKKQEVRQKIANSVKKLWQDPEYRANQIAKRLGKKSHRKGLSMEKEYGKEKADKIKTQMKEKNLGKKYSDAVNKQKGRFGKNNAMSRLEVKEKHKLSCKDPIRCEKISKAIRGDKNPQWLGGAIIYYGPDWPSQKRKAWKKFDRKCVKCNTPENLVLHHIIPYRESKDNSLNNLTVLCRPCHNKLHAGGISM